MKIIVDPEDIRKGLNQFEKRVKKGGCVLDRSGFTHKNFLCLLEAVQEEYNCGRKWDVVDIIEDLNDSIGLDEYGLEIR